MNIERRRDDGLRRALNTPPKPQNELIGMTERAQERKLLQRSAKAKPKDKA